MSPPSGSCADVRPTLPELALGIADGEERALAIEHVAGCGACRHELEELSVTGDDLLALVPEREPPAGFEARVLEQVSAPARPERPRRRRHIRRLSLAAAAATGAAATAIALTLSFSSDRQLAAQYRAALQQAHGQYFASARLRTTEGRPAGTVFAYQGSPSWLFYEVDSEYAGGLYREQIVTRSGRLITLPKFRLAAGTWGVATPVPVRDVEVVRLIREPGGRALAATLPVVER